MENKYHNYTVENIQRKGEIACYKQFLLFSQCFPQQYIFSVSKCSIVGNGLNKNHIYEKIHSNIRQWVYSKNISKNKV